MKYCPKCNTRYDEEIIRFCTKDGTPLVPEEEPNFVAMPSESLPVEPQEDDPAEVTVIRKNTPPPPPPDDDLNFENVQNSPPQRIVVSTDDQINFPPPREKRQPYQAPPRKVNTFLVVLLTIFGTVIVLGGGLGLVWLLQRSNASNTNINSN